MVKDKPAFRRTQEPGPVTGPQGGADDAVVGGPFSQAQITQLMKTEFARARRYEYPVSCLLLRVDRIRQLTETHGAGLKSEIKRHLGRIVGDKTRGHDYLGAMSDGSYLLVLPHTDLDQSALVAERIRAAFAELEVVAGSTVLGLTLSLGVASCDDRDTMFFDTLVSQAEVAMDWAHRDGGDQVVKFERDRFVGPDH